jgi:hypothetical protein
MKMTPERLSRCAIIRDTRRLVVWGCFDELFRRVGWSGGAESGSDRSRNGVETCGKFATAYVCIGLETRLGDLFKLGGGHPALAFLGGQLVNIQWILLLAWLLFGNVIFPGK